MYTGSIIWLFAKYICYAVLYIVDFLWVSGVLWLVLANTLQPMEYHFEDKYLIAVTKHLRVFASLWNNVCQYLRQKLLYQWP